MDKILGEYQHAIQAVLAASEEILSIYNGFFEKIIKEDGSPVTSADLASSKILKEHLSRTPYPITGEETAKQPYSIRQQWEKSWCIDPIDGTKEFIKKNGEFVINIALIHNQQPIFGIIASPIRQKIILGGNNYGAFETHYKTALQPKKWRKLKRLLPLSLPIQLISSRSHYAGNFLALIKRIEATHGPIEGKRMGSALKFFELVNQRASIYPRFAPTMEWDIAAGQAIFEAIGGKIIDIRTKQPLIYNKENLKNPHFIAYHPQLESVVLED